MTSIAFRVMARYFDRKAKDRDLREALADQEHDRWSRWMKHQFDQGTFNDDGTWTMPAEKVEHWTRQMTTPYADLFEEEKDSDREEADKTLKLF